MHLVSGEQLTPEQVEQVKAMFPYRYTVDNERSNSNVHRSYARETDAKWISRHLFWVRKDGGIALRNMAYSWNSLPHGDEDTNEYAEQDQYSREAKRASEAWSDYNSLR